MLSDGRLARYYELKTNKPLYMVRPSKTTYKLTHDDSNLPLHYGWKWDSRIDKLESKYDLLNSGGKMKMGAIDEDEIQRIVSELDERGRWVSTYDGQRLDGQAKMPLGL